MDSDNSRFQLSQARLVPKFSTNRKTGKKPLIKPQAAQLPSMLTRFRLGSRQANAGTSPIPTLSVDTFKKQILGSGRRLRSSTPSAPVDVIPQKPVSEPIQAPTRRPGVSSGEKARQPRRSIFERLKQFISRFLPAKKVRTKEASKVSLNDVRVVRNDLVVADLQVVQRTGPRSGTMSLPQTTVGRAFSAVLNAGGANH